jgi:hypothetical protein
MVSSASKEQIVQHISELLGLLAIDLGEQAFLLLVDTHSRTCNITGCVCFLFWDEYTVCLYCRRNVLPGDCSCSPRG